MGSGGSENALSRWLPSASISESFVGHHGGYRLRIDPGLDRIRLDHVVAALADPGLGSPCHRRWRALLCIFDLEALRWIKVVPRLGLEPRTN